jgi:hypothetical protein
MSNIYNTRSLKSKKQYHPKAKRELRIRFNTRITVKKWRQNTERETHKDGYSASSQDTR